MPFFSPLPIQKFIHLSSHRGKFSGHAMFVDLSGFTALTNALMMSGKEGSEILNDTINALFTPAIDAIERHGGFVASFAGDAFTAIFPKRDANGHDVLGAAIDIRDFFREHGLRTTPFGEFRVSVRIGIGMGTVSWQILPSRPQATYWYSGFAIEAAVISENVAQLNSIVVTKGILQSLPYPGAVNTKKLSNDFRELTNGAIPPSKHRHNIRAVNTRFVPRSILSQKTSGEFRDIVACFINLNRIDAKKIEHILTLSDRFGGYFNKVDVSDKGCVILVLFGAPTALEKMSHRALEFATTIRDEYANVVRIGLTQGTAFAGIVGSKRRCEYTALGLSVNLAARMMMNAEFGAVWCGQRIFESTKDRWQFAELGEYDFKGFSNPIPVYRVTQLRKSQAAPRYLTKMIGRDTELKRLEAVSEAIWKDRRFASVTYLYGEAGQGKSRLIFEFAQAISDRAQVITLSTDPILQNPLNPFVEWIRHTFTSGEIDSIEQRRSYFREQWIKFADRCRSIAPALQQELIRIESIIASMVGLAWEGSNYANIIPRERSTVVRFAIKSLLEAYCQLQPVVLVLEDLHWLDDESKAVVATLTRHAEAIPFKMIVTSRYSDDGSKPRLRLDHDVAVDEIDLNALSPEQISAFTVNLLGSEITESVSDYLFKRSQGNPFYCEQLALYLRETNQLKLVGNRFTLSESAQELPSQIQSILVARIDRLQSGLKQVVHTASVLGREFAVQVLAEMLKSLVSERKSKSATLSKQLATGEQEHIWNAIHELHYLFSHILLRDAAYEMQLKKQVRKLHKLAADTMVHLFEDDYQQWFDIATHFDQAEEWAQAVVYYNKAGMFELEQCHFEKALVANQRSLVLNRQYRGEQQLEMAISHRNLGIIYSRQGVYDRALEEYTKSLEIQLVIMGDRHPDTLMTYNNIGNIYFNKGQFDLALEYHQKSLDIQLVVLGEHHNATAMSYSSIGNIYGRIGKLDKALEVLQKSLEIRLAVLGDCHSDTAWSYGNIGSVYFENREYDKALEVYRKSLEIQLATLGDQHPDTALSYGNIGNVYFNLKEYDRASEVLQKALDIQLAVLGDRHPATANTYNSMGCVYYEKKEYDRALEVFQKALNVRIAALGSRHPFVATSYNNIGSVYNDKGEPSRALEFHQNALEICLAILGERHPKTVSIFKSIYETYEQLGDLEKAAEYRARAEAATK